MGETPGIAGRVEPGLRFMDIDLPGRSSVREPLPLPTMRLLRSSGRVVTLELNEADLLLIIKQASETLMRMKQRRGATVPDSAPKGAAE